MLSLLYTPQQGWMGRNQEQRGLCYRESYSLSNCASVPSHQGAARCWGTFPKWYPPIAVSRAVVGNKHPAVPQLLAGFANTAWDLGVLLRESCWYTSAPWSCLPAKGSRLALPWPQGQGPRPLVPRLMPHSDSTRPVLERKSTKSRQWGRGGEAASPMLPGLITVTSRAGPGGSLVAGSLCQEGRGGSGQPLPCACVCPCRPSSHGEDFTCCPMEGMVGRTLPPAKAPADHCISACFFGRRP